MQMEEEMVRCKSEWAGRSGCSQSADTHVSTDSLHSLTVSLCGQVMSLKALPWNLSAENSMEPLLQTVSGETLLLTDIWFSVGGFVYVSFIT